MLTAVGTPQPIQAAVGQYVRASCQFQSTTPLTGTIIKFNHGFTSTQNAPGGATAWSSVYPMLTGVSAMTFNAPDVWRNYEAEIDVIDAYNFRINLDFFVGTGAGYIGGPTPPDNTKPFGSVPTAVSLFASSAGESAYCTIPIQSSSFCSAGNMAISVDYSSGVVVSLNSSVPVQSTPYAGFYRIDTVSGVQSMPDDLELNYVGLTIGTQIVDNLLSNCFQNASPFNGPGNGSGQTATVTIDPSCIVPGGQYRFYVVYNDGMTWRSCQSEVIELISNEPIIAGDVSYSIDDGTNVFTTGCLTDVPPCKDLEITVKMDKATYDAALLAAGITGDQEDYFTGVKVAIQETFSGAVTAPLRLAMGNILADGVTGKFTYSASPGNDYIVFVFTYTFPDRVDEILVPVQITTVDYFVIQPPSEFCAEETGDLSFTLPDAVGTTFATQYDVPGQFEAATGLTVAGTTLTIDRASIPVGTSRCYEICSESVTTVDQPCVCDCDCITVQYTGQACDGLNYVGELSVPGVLPSDIKYLRIETEGAFYIQLNGNQAVVNGTAVERFPVSFYLRGELALKNGCVYTIPAVNFELSPDGSGIEPCDRTVTREICNANCDCADVPPAPAACNNSIAIEQTCINGDLDFVHTESFGSPVVTDVIECSFDGVTWGPCTGNYKLNEVHARRTVTFSDGCPDIFASIIGRCSPEVNCVNSAFVDVDKTNVLLTLTMMGTYGSTVATEEIFYSLDGGATYLVYLSPVTLTGSEEIRVYSLTTFADGCPDVLTPVIDATGTVLSGQPFVSYCDTDGNITGFALAVVDENGSTTLYYNANMVQQPTAPLGSPCENFVDCDTCP